MSAGGQESQAPRKGRPPGSVSLTEERAQTILTYIRAGTFDHVAAGVVGDVHATPRSRFAAKMIASICPCIRHYAPF